MLSAHYMILVQFLRSATSTKKDQSQIGKQAC